MKHLVIHAEHPMKSDKTRCGISTSSGYVAEIQDVNCKRCLINIQWEKENKGG